MKNQKIALIYSSKSATYELVRITEKMNSNDTSIIWTFDGSKIKTAQKIMKNMNVAQLLNMSDAEMAFG